ncbi:gliding motility-associated C-terminal domain-containing protein [Flagellimonas meridianipacifica]|uniref:Gliding motility-associated-like protein n=1 Tax=Flagellimonas meridianipacifica TaxID=1080225 RepID=A0A2T0MK68_9FLAO|nr:gliding motility-associated C-terminal domain-containing protein [Allomuricauda pacifica]PRX57974.1 gliding motility-associated-like protein [Allomuricauda pacifica]
MSLKKSISRNSIIPILLILGSSANAQQAFHNFGSLQFHSEASVGFHLNLIDDGFFVNNRGLTGFYSDSRLTISGNSNPVFNDLEIFADNGLQLETWVGVTNNANFISGNILTEKNTLNNYLNFINDAFFTGTGDENHINGYAGASNKSLITFPVGEGNRIRHLTVTSNSVNSLVRCAYFFEDPNAPISLSEFFDTDIVATDDLQISNFEFWTLEGSEPSVVTLTWDSQSNISLLAESTENVMVVGWNRESNQWESLGNTGVNGNLNNGSITSNTFLPSDYEIITLGGTDELLEPFSVLELDNYFLTPNGDGVNDFLLIEGIETVPNNILNIYNRYGVLVYSKLNYANEFNGRSNRNAVISRNSGLSAGVYFYVLTVNDTREKFQGYLYISDSQ